MGRITHKRTKPDFTPDFIPNIIDFVPPQWYTIPEKLGGVNMGDTITVKEAAKLWGITERRVTVLCKEGRIKGAYKKNRSWVIPIKL